MTAARPSAALAAWTELNDRQQGVLRAIYEADQAKENARKRAGASRNYDRTPASEWRHIDFAHNPSDRRLFGWADLQMTLEHYGWDNQGNGSTMAALADRGLITRSARPTLLGHMNTVALTRAGRAAARAGVSLTPHNVAKAALGRRAWEVLALLWKVDLAGGILQWANSTTIERVLIGKHVPPLAEYRPSGYAITDRGRDFYREQYAAHVRAHPDVRAEHPDGTDADPWPARADQILTEHRRYYRALCAAWREARDAATAAEAEHAVTAPEPAQILPTEVHAMIAARHQLWQDTARARAELATTHSAELHQRGLQAARAYAAAALTAFSAAVTGADPLTGLQPPGTHDGWDEPRLALPSETGIHAIDAKVRALHATAMGKPLRRRGPAPAQRRRLSARPAREPAPGSEFAALAEFLTEYTSGGELHRRLHSVV